MNEKNEGRVVTSEKMAELEENHKPSVDEPENQDKDLARELYEHTDSTKGFLLARTFRANESRDATSGEPCGVEKELAFLENTKGFIFVNPTTVISKQFPAKTISQLPGNNWSGQPSLLFSIQPERNASIANYGLASLNSFSSTDAIQLMGKFTTIENQNSNELTLSKKMVILQEFLHKNWTKTLDAVKEEAAKLEGRLFKGRNPDKTFYKPFDLFFHAKKDYNQLLYSLETLYSNLVEANNLCCIHHDVELEPHPLAVIFQTEGDNNSTTSPITDTEENSESNSDNEAENIKTRVTLKETFEKGSTSNTRPMTEERANKLKGLLVQAVGTHHNQSIKKVAELRREGRIGRNEINTELKRDAMIYEQYCNYLDTGARHNELVSRVYPWEIIGIEWGIDESCRKSASTALWKTIEQRKRLHEELSENGVEHQLFTDFMINKLSIEKPTLYKTDLETELRRMKETEMESLMTILNEIKFQLQRPISLYEYSPNKRELTNISKLIASHNDMLENNPILAQGEECKRLFEQGTIEYRKESSPVRERALENTVSTRSEEQMNLNKATQSAIKKGVFPVKLRSCFLLGEIAHV